MCLGVLAKAIESRDFDGKIFLQRVSEEKAYAKTTYNQNFSDHASVNGLLKAGEWKDIVVSDMELEELKYALAGQYDLDAPIVDRIVIRYYVGPENKRRPKYIEGNDARLPNLTVGDYTLMVKNNPGDKREVDVSCDSKFMKNIMPKVGKAIRDAYHWVSRDIPIFMYLDNAGGHGTKEVVTAYVKALLDEYNVVCVHQRPRSPCTNLLDLGVWMALQNVVEKLHFRKRMETTALCGTVVEAWKSLQPIKLLNVYNRWLLVLDLIIEDNGGNRLVETKRGKLYRAPSAEIENLEEEVDDEDDEEGEIDAIE